ncbi:uncharacterized protein LOC124125878 isoform X1 [Haliotis rufescens]|uniref:uncharacterized protein LOC124125878 isoform X1 n=3 Tax=Haliotis rufescens TaxID=6454 RepID=UPI00201E7E07|nr:uncharacterized protein LOC124125878 isoform X1 [Haliotis rufescens]
MLQMDRLVASSFWKNPKRSTKKLCWFAGEMSRDEAERKLDGKVPGTFMIRMSATHREEGSFVLSLVMADETTEHFLIEGHPSQAVQSNPFSLCLTFQGHTFSGLPDLVNEYLVRTDISDGDPDNGTRCQRVCSDLPYNGILSSYKK